jgi:predicted phage baseplate assembly protein
MALISPILDDRSYEQLREELLRRIPVYTSEWTDHNETDPGIALLELFAYLGESVLYRFNQIPDTTKIEFLRLLGVQPRPPLPATALLAATTELAAGVQIAKGVKASAGSVGFETVAETYVWPLDSAAVGKTPAPASDGSRAEEDRRDDAKARVGLPPSAAADFYVTTQLPEDPAASDAVVLDVSSTLDHSLWIAVLRKKTTDVGQLAQRSLFTGVAFDEKVDTPPALRTPPGPGTADQFASGGLNTDPPPMIWQLWNGPGKGFSLLSIGDDTTRGMTTTGVVEVLLPAQLPAFDPAARPPADQNKQVNPPPLTDEKQAANVIAWIRVSRPDTAHINDAIHRIRWVGLNATRAEQALTAKPELLGTGTGDAGQRYPLTQHPVLPGTVSLQVEETGGWRDWEEVDAFTASTADDRHYTVDYSAGSVEFGGIRLPQLGERIRVLSYRYGGGLAGNVAAGAVNAVSGVASVKIANPLPAACGADAATMNEALDAIPADVHRRDRAVIADDFRDLALQVTGVKRAETLPLFHPDTPAADAAGVISVVVFPAEDLASPDAPMPDLGLLRRVARYLDLRRLVTTELYVIPPTYHKLVVSVGLAVHTGYQVDAVRRWVEQILRQYLAPLPPSGPDGTGWPLGRTVRRAELEAVVVQVEGVDAVNDLILAEPNPAGTSYRVVPELALGKWEVPELVALAVVSGDPLPAGEAYQPPAPTGTSVPLPPDVC